MVTQEEARKIMGQNFLGPDEIQRFMKIRPTRQQCATLKDVPFTEGALVESHEDYVLVATFPCSLLALSKKFGKVFCNQESAWMQREYDEEIFALSAGETGWHLVRKTMSPYSFGANWQTQRRLVIGENEVPDVRVVAFAVIGYYLATGDRLFQRDIVRTNSTNMSGDHVYIGEFGEDGLRIGLHSDTFVATNLGVASKRKTSFRAP